jgi:two-component system, NtrC family, sensor kinase
MKQYGDLRSVNCYAGLMNQVFLNLLTNAIDALDDLKPGDGNGIAPARIITITTEAVGGDRVAVRIQDNGVGIDEAIQGKIFDPFFTTKPVGSGTGLGLAICYQVVVDQHQGKLSCFSTLGMGTEFVVEMPVNGAVEPGLMSQVALQE